jgi:isopenicillin N synthase-like dioxygenase
MPSSVPLVDLNPWFEGTPDGRSAVAARIDDALRDSGFLLITGHGMPDKLRADTRELSRKFFALPEAAKAKYTVSVGGRGWLPPGVEANGYAEGTETPRDLKESYSVGADAAVGVRRSTRSGSGPTSGRSKYPSWRRSRASTWTTCGGCQTSCSRSLPPRSESHWTISPATPGIRRTPSTSTASRKPPIRPPSSKPAA